MLLRSGVIDLPAYLKLLGKTIASVHAGGGRHKQSLAESSFDAWTKYYKQDENAPNAVVSYYTKGALVALGLDLTIRLATDNRRSLDDVMRLLWQRFGKRFYSGQARGLDETGLAALIKQATGVDVCLALTQWVQGVTDVPLADLLARSGIELTWVSENDTPDLGFTTKPIGPDLMVRQVFEHGPGHIAGLSAGDQLLAVNGLKVGNSEAAFNALLKPYRSEQVIDLHVFRGDLLKVYRLRLAPPKKNTCHLKPMHS
jgi:predicted metalloprotease with PDZ domain